MYDRVLRDYGDSAISIETNSNCKHGYLGQIVLTFKNNNCTKSVECWLCRRKEK